MIGNAIVPSPRPYGERVRVRGGNKLRYSKLPLTPTLSPSSAETGRGGKCEARR
jgi:hypothetical protein